MAQSLKFSLSNCLIWTTHKPTLVGIPLQSPSFSVLGFDCYFHFVPEYRSGFSCPWYCLYLYGKQGEKIRNKDCEIFTVLTSDEKNILASNCAKFNYKENLITVSVEKSVFYQGQKRVTLQGENSQNYSREPWRIFCVFLTGLPVQLDVVRSNTMCLSNLTDLKWNTQQNSEKTDIFMRAKLAAYTSYDCSSGLEVLSSDLNKLLEENSSSDVTFKCGDRTFSAHRSILGARSKVFAAMFETKMLEKQTGVIDITDTDGKTLDLLLKYVYSGKVSHLSVDTATSLYMSADKYAILSLKIECARWMLANMTNANCLDFLFLADTCSDERFKERLTTFISQILDMIDEQAWLKFSEDHPKLANGVYRSVLYKHEALVKTS